MIVLEDIRHGEFIFFHEGCWKYAAPHFTDGDEPERDDADGSACQWCGETIDRDETPTPYITPPPPAGAELASIHTDEGDGIVILTYRTPDGVEHLASGTMHGPTLDELGFYDDLEVA